MKRINVKVIIILISWLCSLSACSVNLIEDNNVVPKDTIENRDVSLDKDSLNNENRDDTIEIFLCQDVLDPVNTLDWLKSLKDEYLSGEFNVDICETQIALAQSQFLIDADLDANSLRKVKAYEILLSSKNPMARDSESATLYDCYGNQIATYSFAWSIYEIIERKILYSNNQ